MTDAQSRTVLDGRTGRALRRLLLKTAALTAAAVLLLTFVFGIYVVHSNNMYPAVRDGDLFITCRLISYQRNDVISYMVAGERHFARIVGLPGDEIHMDESGNYTVNGSIPYETIYYETGPAEDSGVQYPYVVREGELFVLNDLREDKNDSRRYGAIPQKDADGSLVLLLRRREW